MFGTRLAAYCVYYKSTPRLFSFTQCVQFRALNRESSTQLWGEHLHAGFVDWCGWFGCAGGGGKDGKTEKKRKEKKRKEKKRKEKKRKRKRRKEKDDQVVPIIKASRRAQPDAFSQKKTKAKNAPKPLTHQKNTQNDFLTLVFLYWLVSFFVLGGWALGSKPLRLTHNQLCPALLDNEVGAHISLISID